ncbi:MAG TPA: ROK family protein [Capsulimonadaceae bacterium]|jgi:glucokinase
MPDYLIGYDIGGTKCAVNLGRLRGSEVELLDKEAFPTDTARGPGHALASLERITRRMLSERGLATADVRAIGISCGGPLDGRSGTIISPPNLPGWENLAICEHFRERFSVPVALQNDADACAVAEWKWGAGRGARNMIFLTFGTGMGAGLILDGRLYTGATNLAGEVGHIRLAKQGAYGYGKLGSFEGFCSGGGIARLAAAMVYEARLEGVDTRLDADTVTARDVFDFAREGDEVAIEILHTVGTKLGEGLALLVDILNPEVIVIGSIFARAEDLLRPAAEKALREEALSLSAAACRIVPAALGEQIGDYACLSIATLSTNE